MSKRRVVEKSEVKTRCELQFYRRCHVCEALSASDEPICVCASCGKMMAPFFYFDVKNGWSYTDLEHNVALKVPSGKSEERAPIIGLTVYW